MAETDAEPRAKWRAYPETVLMFAEPHALRLDLRRPLSDDARRTLAAAGWSNAFAVLTAENPSGDHEEDEPTAKAERRRDRDNGRRRGGLLHDLRRRRIRTRPVTASSPDGSYTERCVAIDATLAESIAIARDWDQLALFWFDGLAVWLVPAMLDETAVPLPGAPRDR